MEYLQNNTVSEEGLDESRTETSYGHCRCCLEEGHHRDITKVYNGCGAREVYADIFLDCFNVFLSTSVNLSTLICAACVRRLREARDFKALVLRTEEQLMDALQDSDNEQMVLVNVPVAKETLDTTIGFKIQVNNYENPINNKVKKIPDKSTKGNEDSTSSLEAQLENNKPVMKRLHKQGKKPLKKALIINTYQLLAPSNATLFKSKMHSGYPCFYCKEIFEDLGTLKKHQNKQHVKSDLLSALKPYTEESLVVYADVKDLKCTTCDLPMPDLKELKSHLINVHQMKFHKNITDRIVPFKLFDNYFECQICSFNFETFGSIEKHMNTHFRNYVCNICGGGFVTMVRLKSHISNGHRKGTFLCEYCDKVFNTQLKLRVHIDYVHKMIKKLKCHKCPERFSDYFVQKKHMVEVHGEKPIVYRCNVCSKGFSRRYNLSCHMKRHLVQKDFTCNFCSYSCYSNTELKEHMFKHDRLFDVDHSFICSICDKVFTRKKSLKLHMMKIHLDEKRYVCDICDQSFVHSHSLLIHMKKQHDDLNSVGDIECNETNESFDQNDLGIHMDTS